MFVSATAWLTAQNKAHRAAYCKGVQLHTVWLQHNPFGLTGRFGFASLGPHELLTLCIFPLCLLLILTAGNKSPADNARCIVGQSTLSQERAKENVCCIHVHFTFAIKTQALLCSVYKSWSPVNSRDWTGISHVYGFFKGGGVRSPLPSSLAVLEKDTPHHVKSLEPYVPFLVLMAAAQLCTKAGYWVTGTIASSELVESYLPGMMIQWPKSDVSFNVNLRIIWLYFCFPRKKFSFHSLQFSKNWRQQSSHTVQDAPGNFQSAMSRICQEFYI